MGFSNLDKLLITKRHHHALLAWQKKYFPELEMLTGHWNKHFAAEEPYKLCAKLSPAKSTFIELGLYKGRQKIRRASDMKGNMLYTAIRIIKAQCSTELGSIQQHRQTLDAIDSDFAKYSILRIMAEEFRHAYQMFWVLSHDASWRESGVVNLAEKTMDELLDMHTGTHVLDAFNIPFHDPLDNIVYAALIDRVGRYQLSMQKVFAYEPMARSMQPMLDEEHFHLKTGVGLLREVVMRAARGESHYSVQEIQKRINAWLPRALDMFGNPAAGETNITFGFKDKLNGESADAYLAEVKNLLRFFNRTILQVHLGTSVADQDVYNAMTRISGQVFLSLPHKNFFRMRSDEQVNFKPVSVDGDLLSPQVFIQHLQSVLPGHLLHSEFFQTYLKQLHDQQIH